MTPSSRVGIPWQREPDSYFQGIHITEPPVDDRGGDYDGGGDGDDDDGGAYMDPPRSSVQLDHPSSSAPSDKERPRPSLARTMLDMVTIRRSRRDNKGKNPSKYTPS
ncbi:serine/threonine-protein phosphatase 7 long form [Salvia divinorum]|uniref:Serine/threonine-protein phosphatase 7 long form n=1 Tax=Salvia divinorum TaxID=28513 RepID=A0ABD1HQX9_SALDI